MADINLGDDSLLTKTLEPTDRVTITRAATGQTIGTITVEDLMQKCAQMIPAATETARGVLTPEQLRGGCYKVLYIPVGQTRIIGRVSGLMSFQNSMGWSGRTELVMVDTAFNQVRQVTHVAGWEYPAEWGTFSFDESGNLCFTNLLEYGTYLTVVYQNLEK